MLISSFDIFVRLHFRGGRYTEEDAKKIVVQMLSVVAFCHLQGVVHRDLKPEVLQTQNNLYVFGGLHPLHALLYILAEFSICHKR